jgi:hypothetical protein
VTVMPWSRSCGNTPTKPTPGPACSASRRPTSRTTWPTSPR